MSLLLLLNKCVSMVYNTMVYTNETYFVIYYKFRYPMTIQHIRYIIIMPTLFT